MEKFIRLLLAPLLALALVNLTVAPAFATPPRGTAFYEGAENPEELAQVIEASLREDPSGRTKVRPRDPGDRAFASPHDYLVMIRQSLQRRGANAAALARVARVDQLPAYLRTLVVAEAPRGRFWSSCITPQGPVLRCMRRAFHPGEQAWVDPATALTLFKRDCTNVIEGGDEPDDCVVIAYNYSERHEVAWRREDGQQFAAVSTHLSFTEEQFRRIYADSCYFVEDGNGRRKPEPDCPALYCPPGSQWPQVALAGAVGLPTERPPTSIHFLLLDGVGTLSLPRSVLGELTLFVPCVVTVPYPVSVEGYRRYRAVARFDRVEVREIREMRVSGRLDRVMTGSLHY